MRRLLERKRLLMLVCFVATLGLAACGDDDNGGNNGAGNNGGNNGADVGVDIGGDEDTGDDEETEDDEDTEDDDDTTDPNGDECDVTGFTAPTDMVMAEEGDYWSLYGESSTQIINLVMLKDGGLTDVGTAEFQDVEYAEMANPLMMANGCSSEGCEAFFLATSGTLEVTTWDQENEDGDFEATLTDVELVEVEFDQFGGISRLADGQTWCIDSADLTATVDLPDQFPEEVSCDNEGFTADGGVNAQAAESTVLIEALSSEAEPYNVLSLQIYGGEEYGGAETAGEYQIDDFNYATCGNCVLIYADCTEEEGCQRTFTAGEGTLDITAMEGPGGQFTATLTDARLIEVTVDPETYESSLVEDGEGWCIDSYSWDLQLEIPEQG